MKKANQDPGLLRSRLFGHAFMLITYCLLLLMPGWARGQTKEYATVTPSSKVERKIVGLGIPGPWGDSNNSEHGAVVNPAYASNNSDGSYAELHAGMKVVAVVGGFYGQSWIQMKFDETIPANTPTYVRLGELEKDGGGLDVLGLVTGDILGLISNEIVVPSAYKGASASTDGTEISSTKNLLRGQDGFLYAVVTPSEAYNSVRIRLRNADNPLLGLLAIEFSKLKLKVYNAFYYKNITACSPALFSDLGKTTGISVNLGDVVKNPEFAIDENTSSYSEISTGALSVAATAAQNIYFPALSEPTSTLKVRLGIESSTLNLELLGAYTVKVYNGNTFVQSFPLQSGLINGLDLLGILGKGGANTVSFNVTDGAYDRVEIGMFSTVGLDLAASKLRIYDVSRTSASCPEPDPTSNPLISPVCANANIVSSEYVDDVAFATDGNFDSYASIRSGAGILLGLGKQAGHLEVEFPSAVPIGKTAYIRIDYDETVLKALLAGSLGNTVGGLVNGLLLGEHYFTVEAKSTAESANDFSGSSIDNFSSTNGKIRIVQDSKGRYYIAIKSDKEYNRVRITDNTNAAITGILAPDQYLNVYSVCYENSDGICDPAFSTSYDGSGLGLDLLDLGGNGVENAHYAIDGNTTTKSQINLGLANLGGSMEQFIDFNALSNPQDHFSVTLSLNNGALADVSVLSNIEIKAYANGQVVFLQKISEDILGLDLLNLLKNGQAATLRIAPGKAFDRVSIGKSALVDVNLLSSPLYVHEVKRFSADCPDTELSWDLKTTGPFKKAACVSELISFENVNFPLEAVTDNPNFDTYATLTAGAGTAAGLGAYSSHIELKYEDNVPAHEVSYIRIEAEGDLFNALLGGSLGDALGDILGSVALGKQNIVVQALDASGNPVGNKYSSLAGFDTEYVKLVKDKNGKFYLAVTADVAYQAVRIEFHQNALLGLSGSSALKVYSMCRETEFDACEQATFTSWDSDGIALDLLDLTNGGVANPEFAIDADNSNYSTLNMGVAGVGASVSQKLYFKTKSSQTDELRVRLQLANPGVLNLDLFGESELIFYNGEQKVKNLELSDGIINNLDLLALFKSGGIQSFTFAPGVEYDRVELKLKTVLGVNTSAPVRLYGMSRITAGCPDPDFLSPNDVFNTPVCADIIDLSEVKAVDDVNNAIDGDYNTYATMRADAGAIFGINKQPSVLELNFQNTVAKDVTSYLRISDDKGVLDALLSGSLGNTVYKLLNNIALGDNYFVVRAKNGENQVIVGSSRDNFAEAKGLIKLVQDKAGRYFVAISPNAPYTSVEIKSFSESAVGVLANGYNLNVYGMCYQTQFDDCPKAFSTSWDGNGLNLGLNGAAAEGVVDAFKALDNNNNGDYSTLNTGVLSVGGFIQQNIQFPTAIPANTNLKLKLEIGTGAVNVGAFDEISIIGYKSGVKVYEQPIATAAVGVSLEDLFSNGGAHDIKMSLNTEVDEIALRLGAFVGVTVQPDVRLYYINVDCNKPSFISWKSADRTEVKGGEEIEYTIHVRNTGSVDVNGLIIEDEIPENTTYVDASAVGGTFDAGSNVVTFNSVHVSVGDTYTAKFKTLVNENLTNVEKIRNVALVKTSTTDKGVETFPADSTNSDEPLENGTTGTEISVIQEKTVSAWKAYTIGANDKTSKVVSGGEEVTYHIYVRNTGNQDLSNVVVSDALPKGLTWKSGGAHDNGKVTLTIPTLSVGETSQPQNIVVTVNKDLTEIDAITNIAVVHLDPNDSNKDVESVPPTDNTDPTKPAEGIGPGTVLNVQKKYDIVFSKIGKNAANTGKTAPGEEITYTLTVHNVGNQSLTNIKIEDVLPANTTYVNGGDLIGTTKVEFNLASLAVDAVETVTFTVKVYDPLDATVPAIVNEAVAKFKGENGADLEKVATHRMPLTCESVNAGSFTVKQNTNLCEGETITLTADVSGLKPGTVVKWFADVNLNVFIKEGLTLDVKPVAGAKYYAIVEHDEYCFGGNPKEYPVKFLPTATANDITVTGSTTDICEGSEINLVASSTIQGATYKWYADAALTQELATDPTIADGSVLRISPNQSGSVYVTVFATSHCTNTTTAKKVEYTITPAPKLVVNGDLILYVAPNATIPWPSITSPDGTVEWYDKDGNSLVNGRPSSIDAIGVYTYTALVNSNGCISAQSVIVNVYDGASCPPGYVREYAKEQSWGNALTGAITNRAGAIDGKVKTYSTLTTGVGLLGIGTVWQNLYFAEEQKAGTPVTLKLGKEYSGVAVAGAISVVGLDRVVGDYDARGSVGPIRPIGGGLLDVLSSDNIIEYTFVPTDWSGKPVAYKGVRVVQGALLSLAQNARVYGAYVTKEGQPSCDPIDNETNKSVIDVLHGVRDISVGLLSSLSTVKDPWKAVDNNPNSFAEIWNGLGALNQSFIRPVFKKRTMPSDSLQIITEIPGQPVLTLELFKDYRIQRYLGDSKVGDPILPHDNNNILNLRLLGLLGSGQQKVALRLSDGEVFDRVELSYLHTVSLLGDFVKVYDIDVLPKIERGGTNSQDFEICAGDNLVIKKQDDCTRYKMYDANGNEVVASDGYTFTIPGTTPAGEHIYYVQAIRDNCEVGPRQEFKVLVNPVPTISEIKLNGAVEPNNEITLAPGQDLRINVAVQENGADLSVIAWQIKDANGNWKPNLPEGFTQSGYNATMVIPGDGRIGGVDYRGKTLEFKMIFLGTKCNVESEVITLHISDSKFDFSDDNIVKTATAGIGAQATAGEEFSYTVTVKNGGPSTIVAGDILYFQDLPSDGQTLKSVTPGAENNVALVESVDLNNSGFKVRALKDIPKDGTFNFEVVVDVDPTIEKNIVKNTIKIWVKDPNGNYNDVNNPADGTAISPEYDVIRNYGFNDDAITKVGNATSAVAGTSFSYTVTVKNNGPSTILGGTPIYFQDVLSQGQVMTGVTSQDGAATVLTDGLFNLVLNREIAKDASFTMIVNVDVLADIADDHISNTIHIWQNNPGADVSTLPTPDGTVTTPDIPVDRDYGWGKQGAVTKAGDAASATAGEVFSYTVTLTNKGTSTIRPNTVLYLQDVLSAGQTITGITSGNGTLGAVDSDGAFTLTVENPVVVNGSIELNIEVLVATDITADHINNTINIWSKDPAGVYTAPEGTATTPDIPVVRDYGWNDPDAVNKEGNKATAIAGKGYVYTVTLTNKGKSTINAGTVLYLQDVVTDGQTLGAITSNNGAVSSVATDGTFTLTVDNAVASGESMTLTVNVDVAADILSNEIRNTINIWTNNPGTDLTTPDGTATTQPIPVDRDYGWNDPEAVKKAGNATSATAGEAYVYKVTLTNKGTSTILPNTVLYLQDAVSAGQSITGITSNNGTLGTVGSDGSFSLTVTNAVAADESIELTVEVSVATDITADHINNTINIWSKDPAGDYTDPEGTATTPNIPVDRDYGWNEPGAVVKEAVGTPVAGETFTYTVTLTNKGSSAILTGTELRMQDVLSADQSIKTMVSDKGAVTMPDADGFFTLTVDQPVVVGEQIKLTVTVDINPDAQVTFVQNTINIWEDKTPTTSTPDGTDTTDPETIVFNSKFTVVKTTDATEAVAGEKVKFDVVLTNAGPSTAKIGKKILVTEKPGNMIITTDDIKVTSGNAKLDGTYNAATGEFTLDVTSDVKLGEKITLEVFALVPADATGTVKNGIEVDGDETTTPPVDVVDKVKFAVQKTTTATEAIAGESVDFKVILTNNGPSTAKSGYKVLITEKPEGLVINGSDITVTSGNGTFDGNYNSTTGEFTIVVSNEVAVGGVIELNIKGHVRANATGTVKNGIEVDGEETTTPPVDVVDVVNFAVQKTTAATEAIAGESVDFKVVLTNNGPSTAKLGREVIITEKPDGLVINGSDITVTSGNATFDGTYDVTTGVFKISVSNEVAVGGTIELNIKGHVPANATGTVKNGIEVDGNTDVTDPTPVVPKTDLSIMKVADEASVIAGTNTSFTVTITNNGPSVLASGKVIHLGEMPSAGLTITGYEVTSGNAVAVGTGNSATVTTNADVDVNGTIEVKVTAAVAADAPEKISNGIKVWGPDTPTTGEPDDEVTTPEVPVDRAYNVSITKVADEQKVIAGTNTSFTLTITNNGPSDILSGKVINLTEMPSAGLAITGYEVTSGNATAAGTGNSATITTNTAVVVGATIVVKVNAAVDADAPTEISNGIQVWGPDKPTTGQPDDEDKTPQIPVDRDYRLTVEKIADQDRVEAGKTTTFTVTVTNNGPSIMEVGKDIKLEERPGAGVIIENYEIVGNNATIANSGNNATVTTTAKLAVGGTIVVRITAKIDDEAPEKITNGIAVWRPGKPETEEPDDKTETPEVPVDYPLIEAVDDIVETKTALPVNIDVLANDIVTKWPIDATTVEVGATSAGAAVRVEADGTITYVSSRDMVGEDKFTYRVKDSKGRWSNWATVRVSVASNDLDIPNIITPNGDGKNDSFYIKGLELFDRVGLTIVNRWGNEVYKNNNYDNNWNGVGLSEGTYFYVLELEKNGKVEAHRGWVTIKSN